MDKLEVLSRAWIDCDPNRAGNPPGSGFHPDDIMEGYQETELRNAKGEVVTISGGGSDEMKGLPRWRWFLPRAVLLEDYLEQHGFVIVKLEQALGGKG